VLRAEAAWLARELERIPAADLSPLLCIGSGDAELRARQQWIDRVVYRPLAERGVRVIHHELEPGAGVDVAGDLTDDGFVDHLAGLGVRSILCCNVLEHVPNPEALALAIVRIVAPGGYAVVTVPRRYPYHPGPIDTLFRPSVDELRRLFGGLGPVAEAEVRCESLLGYLLASPDKSGAIVRGLRSLAGNRGRRSGRPSVPLRDAVRMMVFSTAVSGVVLRALAVGDRNGPC
jgi:SAM-dependent methyltransferase